MKIKTSDLDGSWYTSNPTELKKQLASYFSKVPANSQKYKAVFAPHAGFTYSGLSCAHAISALQEAPVYILLATAHRARSKKLIIPDWELFQSPFGKIEVDRTIIDNLKNNSSVEINSNAFISENSIEMTLVPLQYFFGNKFKIIPILAGAYSLENATVIAELLSKYQAPLLLSGDFTHYGSPFGYTPFKSQSLEETKSGLEKLENPIIQEIMNGDLEKVEMEMEKNSATICGKYVLYNFLAALKILSKTNVKSVHLHHSTSLDVSNEYSSAVSYRALAWNWE